MLRAAAGVGRGCSCSAAARSSASGRLARGRSTWRCTRVRRGRVDLSRGRSYVSAAPMTLALYNTLTRRVEPFAPLAPPRVTLYTCGPTVWNYAHIGNFRTFLFEDLLRRYLAYSGYDVFHIMNLTDVDDRTIKAAAAAGKRLEAHTAPFVQAFFEDRDYLRITPAHVYPRATQSVPAMVRLVERLLERGVAYKGEDGSIYFAIAKFPTYGRLSRLDTRELKVGARVASDEYAKDDPRDFALWKKAEPADEQVGAAWDAPFGRGRPGWHLECSAMSLEQIGACCHTQTLDIHAGGVDLIFPHHEDEIAQSEGATGKTFARYWLHAQHLQDATGEKMSKRLKNFATVRELLAEGYTPRAIRYALLTGAHYRSPLAFSPELLKAADSAVKRLDEFAVRLGPSPYPDPPPGGGREIDQVRQRWDEALNDDLNLPAAVGHLFEFIKAFNPRLESGKATADERAAAMAMLRHANRILDVIEFPGALDAEVERLIAEREAAREQRGFARADQIRKQLLGMGIQL